METHLTEIRTELRTAIYDNGPHLASKPPRARGKVRGRASSGACVGERTPETAMVVSAGSDWESVNCRERPDIKNVFVEKTIRRICHCMSRGSTARKPSTFTFTLPGGPLDMPFPALCPC